MYSSSVESRVPGALGLVGGLLALAAASGLVAWAADPVFVPLLILGAIGGAVVLMRPELGVFVMFAMILFKPDAIQGLGWLGPNTLISVGLSAILFITVVTGGSIDFLRSNQIRIFMLLGAVLAVNWVVVGRIDPPGILADRDFTNRTLYRFVVQSSLLTFVLAYVRTRGQILTLNALYVGAIVLTVGLTLLGVATDDGGEGRTGAKHLAKLAAAGNVTKVEAARAAAAAGVQAAENANRLAFFSLTAISLIWFAILHYRWLLLRLVGGVAIVFLILTVFRTGSRSGVVNLMLLLVLLLVQSRLNPGRLATFILMGFVAGGVVVAFVPDIVLDRLASLVVAQDDQPRSLVESNVRRLAILAAGLKMVATSPFMGIGIGNFRWMAALDPEFGGISMAAHNAYLLALAEGGVVLLACYVLLFCVTGRDLVRTLRIADRHPEVGLTWLVRATLTNLILLAVFSLFAEAWKEIFFVTILVTAGVLSLMYRRAARAGGATA